MKLTSIIVSAVITLFGFAGGGGSDSGGGGSDSGGSWSSSSSDGGSCSSSLECALPFILAVIIYVPLIISGLIHNTKRRQEEQERLTSNSSTPQERFIRERGQQIFEQYQSDWSDFKLDNIQGYTTSRYFEHVRLMLEVLSSLGRANKVSELGVDGVCLLDPVNDSTPLPVKVRIEFWFHGLDEVVENSGNKLFSNYAKKVKETWNFIYDGKTLRLDGISQPTESSSHLIKSLADFANQNNLYYSPDWGRYALPTRGLIFDQASMIISDINNHIVGRWRDLLIQLYSYSSTPGDPSTYYIVGQITVPKIYDGIIVKSKLQKPDLNQLIDSSYTKYELEWTDFNKRYDVHAASADAVTAFELLNPKFMEYLYSKNPNYNIEVINNTIYLFSRVGSITERDYVDLLDILSMAHKELKM